MTATKNALAALGWRVDTTARLNQAVKDFQRGWNLGPALAIDGNAGPATRAALDLSMQRRSQGLPDFSAHFNAREFACACGGQYADCRRIWVVRDLVQAAEELRKVLGPFTPLRACRCPKQNKAVGGATNSQHLYGAALDLGTEKQVYNVSVTAIRNLKRFSGIGYYDIGGGRTVVRHVDVRHASPTRTDGTISAPARWVYGSLGSRIVMNPRPELAFEPKPTAPTPAPAPAPAPSPEEDDMPLTPADISAIWGAEIGSGDNRRSMATAISRTESNSVAALARVTALEAVVKELGKGQGIDPNAITKAVEAAVRDAIAGIDVTVRTTPATQGD